LERHGGRALEVPAKRPEGETPQKLRRLLGLNARRLSEVLDSLIDDGWLITSKIERHERIETAYRLPRDTKASAEATSNGGPS